MTALLEKLIAIIAPHSCFVCGAEDNILCDTCLNEVFVPLHSACVYCEKPTIDWRTCAKCSRKTSTDSVWAAAEYKDCVADLLRRYKFDRLKAAHIPLAKALDASLPYIGPDALVVPLPSAHARVRQRGYDQSVLLAKELARLRNLSFTTAITRQSGDRQLGSNRKVRQAQARLAYSLPSPSLVKGRQVWLVDDICTTGASLNAAAKLLKKAGATEVNGVVVAWQKLVS